MTKGLEALTNLLHKRSNNLNSINLNKPSIEVGFKNDFLEAIKMSLLQQSRKILAACVLILVLTLTTACGGGTATQAKGTVNPPVVGRDVAYGQLERGDSPAAQNFGDWVVQASKGLITDAFVRDNNKLGVVISSKVPPSDVRALAKSLVEGFHKNFPNQDLTVLVYAPDKKLILTTQYDVQTKQVQYT